MTNIRTIRKFALIPTSPTSKPRASLVNQLNVIRERKDIDPSAFSGRSRRLVRRAAARAQRRLGIYVR